MFSYNLHENERLIHIGRQAESVLLGPALFIMAGVYIPWALILRGNLLGKLIWWILAWTLILLGYAVYRYIIWLISVHIITNKRAIHIRYRSVFFKDVDEIQLTDIHAAKIRSTGILGGLFGYANLYLESGTPESGIIFLNIHEGEKIKLMLWEARERAHSVPIVNRSPQKFELSVHHVQKKKIV